MKHHIPCLFLALAGLFLAPPDLSASKASDTCPKISNLSGWLDASADLEPVSIDGPVFVAEISPIELAFLPITPAPAIVERASTRVPRAHVTSGHQIHAWLDPLRICRGNLPDSTHSRRAATTRAIPLRLC